MHIAWSLSILKRVGNRLQPRWTDDDKIRDKCLEVDETQNNRKNPKNLPIFVNMPNLACVPHKAVKRSITLVLEIKRPVFWGASFLENLLRIVGFRRSFQPFFVCVAA